MIEDNGDPYNPASAAFIGHEPTADTSFGPGLVILCDRSRVKL